MPEKQRVFRGFTWVLEELSATSPVSSGILVSAKTGSSRGSWLPGGV